MPKEWILNSAINRWGLRKKNRVAPYPMKLENARRRQLMTGSDIINWLAD